MKQLAIFLFVFLSKSSHAIDPCNDYTVLSEMERRYVSYQCDNINGEVDICDKYLPDGGKWYKAEIDMPVSPPDIFSCGTTYPIWFKGEIPKDVNQVSYGKGCVKKSNSITCEKEYPVEIKHCGSYKVYHLRPSTKCPEAYCFGNGTLDTPPTEVLRQPVITVDLVPIQFDGSVKDRLEYKCFFGSASELQSAFYQVTWLRHGHSFLTNVSEKSKLDKLHLSEKHLTTLDVSLQCYVRAKNFKDGRAGRTSTSDAFYSGIRVNSTTLALKTENDRSANVEFNLAVPFGCLWRDGEQSKCEMTIQMVVPDTANTNPKCSGEIASHALHCRMMFSSTDWNKTQSMSITYKSTETYQQFLKTFVARFAVSADHDIWDGYKLQDIQVNIYSDEALIGKIAGKTCESHNDPHMKTFDGRKYEHQQPGVYTLYEHFDQNRKMEVQIKLKSCNPWNQGIYCNCGVAVRSGGDVFIVDKCNPSERMEFITCNDKILDVRKLKPNEKLYSIYFPTGTKVDIAMSIGYMNVDIKPSVHDLDQTRGLCGYFSGTCIDDFRLRSNSQSTVSGTQDECAGQYYTQLYPRDFSNSWKVAVDTDDLFLLAHDAVIDLWNVTDKVCDCPKGNTAEDTFQCSPDSAVTCLRDKTTDRVGVKTCHAIPHGRKRRSTQFPWKSLQRHRQRRAISTEAENVTMTEEQAIEYCSKTIGQSRVFKACSDVPNMDPDASLEKCALDIQLTNSLGWTENTMETYKSNCLGELERNTTLQESTSDDVPSIAQYIKEILCPGFPECSNNGQCVNGTCECDKGFIASDCSIDKTQPPEMFGIRGEGLCDLNEIECDIAFVVGRNIGSSDDLSCSLKEYHITEDGIKNLISSWVVNATLETLMEVHCPLAEGNRTRIRREAKTNTATFLKGYSMSISYDKKHFGKEMDLFIIDTKCQLADLEVDPPVFALKESTCFIEEQCYLDGEGNPNDQCKVCDPLAPYAWSTDTSIQRCIKIEKTPSLTWVAAPVICGGVVLLVVIISIVVIYHKRARARVKTFSSAK